MNIQTKQITKLKQITKDKNIYIITYKHKNPSQFYSTKHIEQYITKTHHSFDYYITLIPIIKKPITVLVNKNRT